MRKPGGLTVTGVYLPLRRGSTRWRPARAVPGRGSAVAAAADLAAGSAPPGGRGRPAV